MNTNEKTKIEFPILNLEMTIHRFIKYLFTVTLFIYFISGCSFSKKKYSINIDSLQVYGDNSINLIAWIADFHYKNEKIFIWDSVQL